MYNMPARSGTGKPNNHFNQEIGAKASVKIVAKLKIHVIQGDRQRLKFVYRTTLYMRYSTSNGRSKKSDLSDFAETWYVCSVHEKQRRFTKISPLKRSFAQSMDVL